MTMLISQAVLNLIFRTTKNINTNITLKGSWQRDGHLGEFKSWCKPKTASNLRCRWWWWLCRRRWHNCVMLKDILPTWYEIKCDISTTISIRRTWARRCWRAAGSRTRSRWTSSEIGRTRVEKDCRDWYLFMGITAIDVIWNVTLVLWMDSRETIDQMSICHLWH